MFSPFFALAAQSPSRQRTFRQLLVIHLLLLASACAWLWRQPIGQPALVLGHLLLVMAIVEGALLIGWRLTQLPRSQALEFLLVSPLRPHWLLLAEALVGLAQLALVTLAGLPLLMLLAVEGRIDPIDPLPLLLMPLTWGALCGLGLTEWAYEPGWVRRWGGRIALGIVLLYLIVGVLAAEHLASWLVLLPAKVSNAFLEGVDALRTHNPFGVLRDWLAIHGEEAGERMLSVQAGALLTLVLLLARAAQRLQRHFHELHYEPVPDVSKARRPRLGSHPLTTWAIQRVSRYSGQVNLWLALGFGTLYAVYKVAGPHWPSWLGQSVFLTCDGAGIAGLTTALTVLAAVPAAFQYGLWDSNDADRCRRLELLLLTHLEGHDYWRAAAAAAWTRGRGYLGVACVLWTAGFLSGELSLPQVEAALACAVLLWSLYFTLGFRAFARGRQASGLGLLLTVGLPLATWLLTRLGHSFLAALTPPGLVHSAQQSAESLSCAWLVGPLLLAVLTLLLGRRSLADCDGQLRRWYARHHGARVMS